MTRQGNTARDESSVAAYAKPDLARILEIADEFVALGVSEEAVEPIRWWVRERRLCGWMGCKHPESAHGEDGCTVPVRDYYEVRYTAEGERLPPRERPCGCAWVEPVVVTPRPVKDNPQS